MTLNISKHLDKNNLHHAYLIEGLREEIVKEVMEFLKSLGIEVYGNPDFYHLTIDSFKVEDARNLKSQSTERGFSQKKNAKKIFIISTNNILLEAQNTLLKMFEEPIENTHFFIIVPDTDALLKTFVSRFYLISSNQNLSLELKQAENFITSPLRNRIDFIKEILSSLEDEQDISMDSTRSKAIKFLNALELLLHQKLFLKNAPSINVNFFNQIFKAREFLRQPGSSTKSLMEAVALNIPTEIKV